MLTRVYISYSVITTVAHPAACEHLGQALVVCNLPCSTHISRYRDWVFCCFMGSCASFPILYSNIRTSGYYFNRWLCSYVAIPPLQILSGLALQFCRKDNMPATAIMANAMVASFRRWHLLGAVVNCFKQEAWRTAVVLSDKTSVS